jgi:mono/diheme cytochrome c family protein
MRINRDKIALTGSGVLAMAAIAIFLLNFGGAAAQSPNQGSMMGQWDRWNPNRMQRDMWGSDNMGPGMRQRKERHRTFMHQGIPAAYRAARNPLSPDAKNIGKGRSLYQANCALCHGATGMGDGEVAKSLSPSPALLAHMIQMPMSVDEYMLWSISDGGAAFGTAMPAYKDVLTKDEIWKIVTYMRAGFPVEQTQQ